MQEAGRCGAWTAAGSSAAPQPLGRRGGAVPPAEHRRQRTARARRQRAACARSARSPTQSRLPRPARAPRGRGVDDLVRVVAAVGSTAAARPPARPARRRRYRAHRRRADVEGEHGRPRARIYPWCGMAVVIASNLRKELAGNLLFDGVSFSVERRDRVALSGPNGAGKTTLLRILSGETEKHGGELAFEKGTRVALHDQRPPLDQGLTLREYVLSGARDLVRLEEELSAARAGDGRRHPRPAHAQPLLGGAGAARARGRLRLARPRDVRPARPRLRRRAPRPAAAHVLGRRADARLARARRSAATPTCCCSTSRRTISTWRASSGSSASCLRSTRR